MTGHVGVAQTWRKGDARQCGANQAGEAEAETNTKPLPIDSV